MHEHTVVNDLVHKIGTIAGGYGVRRVVALKIRVGALSHIPAEHLRDHLEFALRGTPSEGAAIEIELVDDMTGPLAREIVLESVEVEELEEAPVT
jgi:hydrogenase nickel incorporation protein HypA/HybF